MYIEGLKELVYLSNSTGNRVDYVQAGGGNTSVKFENGYMAIKASGYLLKEMTENIGFVVVNSKEIKKFHEVEHDSSIDCGKAATKFASDSIIQINGEKAALPSVEAGFHSVLGRVVLHLHPVYINILMCSKGGVEKAIQITANAGLSCISIPYTMPGYDLTKLIMNEVECHRSKTGSAPQVIFLKNHGVVTHAETADEAIKLMDQCNNAIIEALKLPPFPTPSIEKNGDYFKSTNTWMKKILSESDIPTLLRFSPVYPDQLVYTNNELSVGEGETKIVIKSGEIHYNTGAKEAMALEETMTALVYLYNCMKEKGLELELLSQTDCAKILGWDSEKYRKKLMASS